MPITHQRTHVAVPAQTPTAPITRTSGGSHVAALFMALESAQ